MVARELAQPNRSCANQNQVEQQFWLVTVTSRAKHSCLSSKPAHQPALVGGRGHEEHLTLLHIALSQPAARPSPPVSLSDWW